MTTQKEALTLEFDALFAEHQKLLGELQAMRAVAKPEPVGEAYLCDECQTPFDGAYECPSCGHNEATKEPVYTTPPQRKPLTDEMVVAAARELNKRAAEACNVDEADSWNIYGDEYIEDARAVLEAAHGIKGDA